MTTPVEMTPDDLEQFERFGHVHCPSCGVHLSNGVGDFAGMVERTESLEDALHQQDHEHECLGCGHQFGPKITLEEAQARYKSVKKYENKSTVTGAVALVHEIAASMPDARRKDVIQACVDKGIAFYTARTQYQKWFKAKKSAQGLAKR